MFPLSQNFYGYSHENNSMSFDRLIVNIICQITKSKMFANLFTVSKEKYKYLKGLYDNSHIL